jgi:hypothetical protein
MAGGARRGMPPSKGGAKRGTGPARPVLKPLLGDPGYVAPKAMTPAGKTRGAPPRTGGSRAIRNEPVVPFTPKPGRRVGPRPKPVTMEGAVKRGRGGRRVGPRPMSR